MKDAYSFRPYLYSTLFMIFGGWIGLLLIANYTLPTLAPRWGFYALLVVALSGTALPIVWFFNTRFSENSRPQIIVRESIWFGIYGAILLWLQLGGVLNFSLGFGMGIGMVVIEYLIRARESAPPASE